MAVAVPPSERYQLPGRVEYLRRWAVGRAEIADGVGEDRRDPRRPG
jgi:hypothetical protein